MYLTDASRFLISCVIQHYAPVVGWGGGRNRCIMLIMTLDPGDKQPVLRIRDVYPRSRILIFSHSGSRIQKQQQKRGVKKNKLVVITFDVARNFTKLQIISVLNC
jgi:hypothetical protein